jgi:hypothetical protein
MRAGWRTSSETRGYTDESTDGLSRVYERRGWHAATNLCPWNWSQGVAVAQNNGAAYGCAVIFLTGDAGCGLHDSVPCRDPQSFHILDMSGRPALA